MAGNSSKTGKIQRDPPSIFLPSVSLSLFVRVRARAIKRPRKATIDRGTIAGSRWLIAITITCTLWLLIKSWPTSNLADTHSRSIFEKEREGEREKEKERERSINGGDAGRLELNTGGCSIARHLSVGCRFN